uniref:IPT1 n=1 Tax=Arundo donax TaxID=35708 RepID=A0A0A9H5W5_ARUDO
MGLQEPGCRSLYRRQ